MRTIVLIAGLVMYSCSTTNLKIPTDFMDARMSDVGWDLGLEVLDVKFNRVELETSSSRLNLSGKAVAMAGRNVVAGVDLVHTSLGTSTVLQNLRENGRFRTSLILTGKDSLVFRIFGNKTKIVSLSNLITRIPKYSNTLEMNTDVINSLQQLLGPAMCACEPPIQLKTAVARLDPTEKRLFLIGQVIDRSSNEALPGLSVSHVTGQLTEKRRAEFEIENTHKDTRTNVDGYFSISIALNKDSAIHMEYIGYRSLTIRVGELIK